MKIVLVDNGAGNVRSLVNAVNKVGYDIEIAEKPSDILSADKLIFPGVGAFGAAMQKLEEKGFTTALKQYISEDRPFLGICVGLQSLCLASEESPNVKGLGILPFKVVKFDAKTKSVPHMGWNRVEPQKIDQHWIQRDSFYYFVHSYAIMLPESFTGWECGLTRYQDQVFVSAVRKGNVLATQFHPEKSGAAGLQLLQSFLSGETGSDSKGLFSDPSFSLSKRIVACLDVRANESGDLVVTKGDQYDVKERDESGKSRVRNLGKPVELAQRYFEQGADEIAFLNITSFRELPLRDLPMLQVLSQASKSVFVPLTIGGGIRDMIEPDGTTISALQVAGEYFRSGADKVSIGSDAVYAAEKYLKIGKTGNSSIEQISTVYGAQAVVISVDPRRIYVNEPDPKHFCIKTSPNDQGFVYCWYQCTVKGGREGSDIDVVQLATACEALGAGEILLNCMDKDGTNSGFDIELLNMVKNAVSIPVIASSGAGCAQHFSQVFSETRVEAALAAGIFHRNQVLISDVKKHVSDCGFTVRHQ